MVNIRVVRADEMEVEALTDLALSAQQLLPVSADSASQVTIASGIKHMSEDKSNMSLVASLRKKTVGWMNLYTGMKPLCFISTWHPVIPSVSGRDKIARALIEEAKQLVRRAGFDRLEILFRNPDEKTNVALRTYVDWYTSSGFGLAAEELVMRADLSQYGTPLAPVPEGFELVRISEVSNDELHRPFLQSFLDSQDSLFLSDTRAEQERSFEEWFRRSKPYVEDSSLVLKSSGKVVGFVLVREESGSLELGPIGTVPEFRKRGIGSALLSRCMSALRDHGFKEVFLEMSTSNVPAKDLYLKHGFKEQYRQAYYYWNPPSQS